MLSSAIACVAARLSARRSSYHSEISREVTADACQPRGTLVALHGVSDAQTFLGADDRTVYDSAGRLKT